MKKFIYGLLIRYQMRRNDENLKKAKYHALLALAYWKDADYNEDIAYNVTDTTIYVRLGK